MSEYRSRNTAARPPQRAGQRPPQRQGQRRPPAKRRRRRGANIRFAVFLVIAALLAVGGGIAVSMLLGGGDEPAAVNTPTAQPEVSQPTPAPEVGGSDVLADTGDEGDNIHAPVISEGSAIQVTDLKITPDLDPDWINVLLLGSDQRTPTDPYRTDSMIICSINKSSGEVKLTSLMRDTAMYMGDLGDQSGTFRMNVACYVGGPEYLMQFLNSNLGLNISNYVVVDFTSFSLIAEKLGGIEIDVSQAEMEEINFNLHRQAKVAYEAGMSEEEVYATYTYLEEYGENVHLTGPQVLGYARIRKLDSDSMRTERQRKVLVALLNKLRTRNPQEVIQIGMELSRYVTTNMSIDDIITVALTVLGSNLSEVEQLRLPENGTYLLETRDGESMLYDTNWDANAATLHDFIYNK